MAMEARSWMHSQKQVAPRSRHAKGSKQHQKLYKKHGNQQDPMIISTSSARGDKNKNDHMGSYESHWNELEQLRRDQDKSLVGDVITKSAEKHSVRICMRMV